MSIKGKYIGISNRIPYVVIDTALMEYLRDKDLNKIAYLNHIKEFTKGENRANKVLLHLTSIFSRNEKTIDLFIKSFNINYLEMSSGDRKALILCLFCSSFPIAYDILISFAVGFKVQNILNKQFLLNKIGAIYGGNRSMHIGVDECIPLFIECGLIRREKVGLFSLSNKLLISNKFISELVIYTDIKLSGSKSILIDDLSFKPWYSYFDISSLTPDKFKTLISNKESAVGKGYLTI